MNTEICLCNGPAQFLLLAAALLEDEARAPSGTSPRRRVFVLSAHSTGEAFRTFLYRTVERSGLADQIVCCWDWPEWNGLFADRFPLFPYRFIRRALGGGEVTRVWLSRFPLPLDRLVASVFEDAELIVYEEGTLSYSDAYVQADWRDYFVDSAIGTAFRLQVRRLLQSQGRPRNLGRKIMRRIGKNRSAVRPDLAARVTRFYGVLQDRLGRPALPAHVEVCGIRRAFLAQEMRHFPVQELALPTPASVGKQKRALVLGLPYRHVEKQGIRREDIRSFYAGWIGTLVAAGYQIVWKSHPRDQSDLPQWLQSQLGDAFVVLAEQAQLPIEILYPSLAPDVVIASVSTSLFTAESLYGLPVATYARAMAEAIGYPKRDADFARLEGVRDISALLEPEQLPG